MQNGKGAGLFALYVACAAVFVWFTSVGLPPLVASHFGAGGTANGFMARSSYTLFMLAFVIGLPGLMVLVAWHAVGNDKARINLPNRDYWLAPERRTATVAMLRAGIQWFGVLLVAFLCYAHALVVVANKVQPPQLPESWFIGGLVIFFVVLMIAVRAFLRRFRRDT
ncbi:MAG TPA: hypothetical protein VF931_00900 [Steroidobacteraceae bacterium]